MVLGAIVSVFTSSKEGADDWDTGPNTLGGDGGGTQTSAKEQAGDCLCETPLQKQRKDSRPSAGTCGRQQVDIISGVARH